MSYDSTAEMDDSEILRLPGRQTLEIGVLRALSRRSDVWGAARFAGHAAAMVLCGLLVYLGRERWWTMMPAMALLGATIVTLFAAMHECVHKTAFKNPTLNNVFGWIAGTLCFYNFTYYRRYHTWHHRYTQDPERDPELSSPKPTSLLEYLVHVSGLPFWLMRPWELLEMAIGRKRYPFIPDEARGAVAWSARAQLGVYLAVAAVSIATRSTWALWYWFVPALLGQPFLRLLLIVEHTGCSQDANGLTNTRTTLASWPVRFLMWNMPYHAEHHLYPSIPFFQLPQAHRELRERFAHVAPSYPAANLEVIRGLDQDGNPQ